jgi:hemerythrin-like domain-containing protein
VTSRVGAAEPFTLLAELRDDHRVVDGLAGSLRRWLRDGAEPDARRQFVEALRGFVADRHERVEEEMLFPALVEHAEVPDDRGPLMVLRSEHERVRDLVGRLEQADEGAEMESVVDELSRLLEEHVDKENSVLLPEAEERLRRSTLGSLDAPLPSDRQAIAREVAEALIRRFPPVDDPEVVRGDGCIACSAFAETCRGIEAEWWSSWEWAWHRSRDEG